MYVADPMTLAEQIDSAALGPAEQVLIFLADAHAGQLDELIEAWNAASLPFFGAVFPGLIRGREHLATGAVANVISTHAPPLIADLSGDGIAWAAEPPAATSLPTGHATAIALVDCLAGDISGALFDLFDRYGNTVGYFGAGAGNGNLSAAPCLFTPEGAIRGAALVCIADLASTVCVRHGWRHAAGPFVATRASKTLVEELNWEPAAEVYERHLAELGVGPLTDDDFYQVAKGHPFGIDKEGQEVIVRDPIRRTPSGGLVFVSDVPENSVMHMLRSNAPELIEAAASAAGACRERVGGSPDLCLIADCYSRALFLGDHFADELDAVYHRLCDRCVECVPEGVLALGEIASDGEQMPELFNKTFVVGLLSR